MGGYSFIANSQINNTAMSIFEKLPRITLLTIVLAALTTFSACDNPTDSNDDDHDHGEHTEPYGLVMVMNGEEVITYYRGEITGHLHIDEGSETSLITIEFLNEEKEHIHAEDLDSEYSLGWEVEDSSVLEVEQHDEDGKWSFHLHGKSSGKSKIQFQLMHGDHSDFETPAVTRDDAIEIHVESASS